MMWLFTAVLLALIAITTAAGKTDPLQITGHPQYQICPVVKPCPGQDKTCPGQDKTCPGQDETCPGQDETCSGQDKACPGQDKTCSGQDKGCPVCCITAVFQCTAEGTLPLTFTWWRKTTNYSFLNRWIYSWWWEPEVWKEKVKSNETCFIQMVNDITSQLSFSNTSVPVFEEYFCEVSNADGQSNRSEPAMLFVYEEGMRTAIKVLLCAAILGGGGAVALPVAAPALLTYLGFTSTGIVAGSWAALWQAKWGIGAWFAAMQSAGAAGLHVASYILLGLTGGVAGGVTGGGVTGLIAWLVGKGDHCGLDKQ